MGKLLIQIDELAVSLNFPRDKCSAEAEKIWQPWIVERSGGKARIEITTHRVKNPEAFNSKRFFKGYERLFWAGPHQSLGGIRERGGSLQGKIYAKKKIPARWLYYAVVEPLLHHLMRKVNLFPLHGAGLLHEDRAILVLGKSGAGKSTTSAFFLLAGLKPLSDDDVIVRLKNGDAEALGAEKGIFVKDSTLEKFSELKSMKNGAWVRKPDGIKRMLVPRDPGYQNGQFQSGQIKIILFPEVNPKGNTRLVRFTPQEALLELLQQRPNVWPDYLDHEASSHGLFKLYQALSERAACYRWVLGNDIAAIKETIGRLAGAN